LTPDFSGLWSLIPAHAERAGRLDRKLLAIEFTEPAELDPELDLTLTGFELEEIELLGDTVGSAPKRVPAPVPELDNTVINGRVSGLGSARHREFVMASGELGRREFKRGERAHKNRVPLGASGRYRTNGWDYPGANSFSATRKADHPRSHPSTSATAFPATRPRSLRLALL
jgi:hypothetical protein